MVQRFGLAVKVIQPEAHQIVGLRVIGIARNRLLRRCQRRRIPPLVHQHPGNVPHRGWVLRVQPQHLAEARNRFLMAALL